MENNSTKILLFKCLEADCHQHGQLLNDVLTADLDINPKDFSGQCFDFYMGNYPLKVIL